MKGYILILTTINKEDDAYKIANKLVEERLAACITVLPLGTSYYWWKGKIDKEKEYVLLIKTKKDKYQKVEERLRDLHPYEVPEIISIPIIKGFKEYLNWIDLEVF
ncbi:divalent-cation tolerance protein CutA [Candidatus Aminicenantes bacterium AH-873-B07]|jgi:periplasmic divalent cation tolerance protein|nr:divalent-cation tolerance protein CutA [Candidatus Aminicenantes bacterium AH-873-B07]